MDLDEVIIKVQIDKDITEKQKLNIYMDIINSLNDRFIPVISISTQEKEIFNNKQGFIKEENTNE